MSNQEKTQPDKNAQVETQLRYLSLLTAAEEQLTSQNAARALEHLEQAFACDLADSYEPRMELNTRHAVAHYLKAVARLQQADTQAALASLRDAAINGFRDTALVRDDPRLQGLRNEAGFAKVLQQFPQPPLTDQYAGKLVRDAEFGIAMQMHRKGNFPKLGERAPDFELPLMRAPDQSLKLSDLWKEQPVALVFGSFT